MQRRPMQAVGMPRRPRGLHPPLSLCNPRPPRRPRSRMLCRSWPRQARRRNRSRQPRSLSIRVRSRRAPRAQERATPTICSIRFRTACASASDSRIGAAMSIRRISSLLVLLIAASFPGYYAYTHVLDVQTVTTGIATQAPVSEAVYGAGTVEPARWAKVVPLQRRRLIEICGCEGQNVKAGQVLGRQDDTEERSVLHELELNNEQLQRDLTRAAADRGKDDAAQRDYEQRWTQLEQSKSRIAAQRVRIDELVLRAPLDGMVLRRDGEVGEIAGPTDVLFWVGPPLPLQIFAEISEEEINRIAIGQKAYLRSDAFPQARLRASVSHITPKGDPARKTFRVYLLIPNDTPLRIGMSVEANIIT